MFPEDWFWKVRTTEAPAAREGMMKETMACLREPSDQRHLTSHWVRTATPATLIWANWAISPLAKGGAMERGWLVRAEPVL